MSSPQAEIDKLFGHPTLADQAFGKVADLQRRFARPCPRRVLTPSQVRGLEREWTEARRRGEEVDPTPWAFIGWTELEYERWRSTGVPAGDHVA